MGSTCHPFSILFPPPSLPLLSMFLFLHFGAEFGAATGSAEAAVGAEVERAGNGSRLLWRAALASLDGPGVGCKSSSYLRSYAHYFSTPCRRRNSSRPLTAIAAPALTSRGERVPPLVVVVSCLLSLLPSSSRCTAMVKLVGNEGPKPFEWGRGGRWFRHARHDDSETKTSTARGLARRQRAKLEFSGVARAARTS